MSSYARDIIVLAVATTLAACAAPPVTAPSAVATATKAAIVTPERATRAVAAGKSTKADVLAALGETLVIAFDSGYEVWIYHVSSDPRAAQRRWFRPEAATSAEFVVLFEPSGVVSRTRLRPAPRGG